MGTLHFLGFVWMVAVQFGNDFDAGATLATPTRDGHRHKKCRHYRAAGSGTTSVKLLHIRQPTRRVGEKPGGKVVRECYALPPELWNSRSVITSGGCGPYRIGTRNKR